MPQSYAKYSIQFTTAGAGAAGSQVPHNNSVVDGARTSVCPVSLCTIPTLNQKHDGALSQFSEPLRNLGKTRAIYDLRPRICNESLGPASWACREDLPPCLHIMACCWTYSLLVAGVLLGRLKLFRARLRVLERVAEPTLPVVGYGRARPPLYNLQRHSAGQADPTGGSVFVTIPSTLTTASWTHHWVIIWAS